MKNDKKYDGGCISVEVIEFYYENKLSEEETRLFEEHISNCPLCSDAFDAYEPDKKQEIRKNLNEIKSKINHKKNGASNWKLPAYSAAAAILIFALSFLFQKGGNAPGNNLAEKYLTPYPDVTLHVRGGEKNNELKKAMLAYDAKNYEKAIELFDAILAKEENETARFYNAVSNIESGNAEKTIELLKPIAENENSEFYAEANWYSALAYISINNTEKAKEHLIKLLNNSEYKKKAGELIAEISKNK